MNPSLLLALIILLLPIQQEPERPDEGLWVKVCGESLCISDIAEGSRIRLFEDSNLNPVGVATWSPDAQELAFSASWDSSPSAEHQIFTLDTACVEQPETCQPVRLTSPYDKNPAWSPNGRWIAYTGDLGYLELVSADGGASVGVWRGMHWPRQPGDIRVQYVQWSPDSQWLVAFFQDDDDREPHNNHKILVLSRDGRTLAFEQSTTCKNTYRWQVAFSPNGKQVVYPDNACRFVLADVSGKEAPVRLGKFPYWWTGAFYPQWGGEIDIPQPPSVKGEGCTAIVNQNARLRAGPGTDFEQMGRATSGDVVEVTGQNAAGDWYQLWFVHLTEDKLPWIAGFLLNEITCPEDFVLPVIDDNPR